MTTRLSSAATAAVFLCFFATPSQAEPNWGAIEHARATKAHAKLAAAEQLSEHDAAMRDLADECEKVKDHAELAQACARMMKACDRMKPRGNP